MIKDDREWRKTKSGEPFLCLKPQVTPGVYQIINTANGRVYIGQSEDTAGRWQAHQYQLNSGNHPNRRLAKDAMAYGPLAFLFEIVEVCFGSIDERMTLEAQYIHRAVVGGADLYNDCHIAAKARCLLQTKRPNCLKPLRELFGVQISAHDLNNPSPQRLIWEQRVTQKCPDKFKAFLEEAPRLRAWYAAKLISSA